VGKLGRKSKLLLILIIVFGMGLGFSFGMDTSVKQDFRRWSVNDAIDLTINVSYLFIPQIVELEEQSAGVFGKCKVFTAPLTPERLGLSYERYGVIDSIKAQYLQNLQGTYSDVAYVADEEQVVEYANCLLRYGAVIAQAQLNLYNNLKRVGSMVKGKVKGKMKLEEFQQVVRKALLEAMNTKKFAPSIQNMLRMKIEGPCKFAGGHILCGGYLLKLQPPQELSLQNFTLFGSTFMGIGGHIRISKSAGAENTAFEYIPLQNR
jgi:uncharacterized protein YjhX (UPF0386 family)